VGVTTVLNVRTITVQQIIVALNTYREPLERAAGRRSEAVDY
jgi:hypothetical protein